MTKEYQGKRAGASNALEFAVPEQVSVVMADIAQDMREGLLALAVGAGLQVLDALMDADVIALAGPRGRHDPDRAAVRHGTGAGSVTLGGRRVPVQRPRVRAADGSGELMVVTYGLFSSTEVLGRMALERMLSGLSTRRYQVGLEPIGAAVTQSATATATSRSAVSRRFAKMTETAPSDLLAADLSQLDLVAFMVDGVHFADSCCVVALGIDLDGVKHPLSLLEGSTENATLVTELVVGLRERGLDVTKPILAVLDGSKALHRAVREVFDHPVMARCQLHKMRNVRDHLPERLRGPVEQRMRAAYRADSALDAQAQLNVLAPELDKTHPSAAASLREGLTETLTVLALGVPPTLARTLRSPNAIESMIGICRERSKNVKNWRDPKMAMRWYAAGMIEASRQFRRVNGHLHVPALRAALERYVAEQDVSPERQDENLNAADDHRAATEVPRNSGQPPPVSSPAIVWVPVTESRVCTVRVRDSTKVSKRFQCAGSTALSTPAATRAAVLQTWATASEPAAARASALTWRRIPRRGIHARAR